MKAPQTLGLALLLVAACKPGGDDDDGGTPTPPCVESWVCSPWTTNGADDNGTRTCVDANACGTTLTKPAEAAVLPAFDLNFYKCNVEPIMDQKCGQLGCHGTETDRALRIYSRGRLRITGEIWIEPGCLAAGTMHPSEECIGSIECRCWTLPHSTAEWRRNYDSARGFGLDPAGVPIAAGAEDTSDLIAQAIIGGKPHTGIHLFASGSAEHNTLKGWLSGSTLATCNTQN